MGSLLKAHWLVAKKRFVIFGLIFVGIFAAQGLTFQSWGAAWMALPFSAVMCAFVLFNSHFETESRNEGPALLLTMPYTRTQVALSRYLLGGLYMGAFFLATLAITFVLNAAGLYTLGTWLLGFCHSIGLCGVYLGLMIPVYTRFGYTKSRNTQMVFFFAVALGWMLLARGKMGAFTWTPGLGLTELGYGMGLAALAIGLLCAGVSCALSTRLMAKKQF